MDTGDGAQTTDPGTVDTGNTGKGTDSMNAGAGAVTGGLRCQAAGRKLCVQFRW